MKIPCILFIGVYYSVAWFCSYTHSRGEKSDVHTSPIKLAPFSFCPRKSKVAHPRSFDEGATARPPHAICLPLLLIIESTRVNLGAACPQINCYTGPSTVLPTPRLDRGSGIDMQLIRNTPSPPSARAGCPPYDTRRWLSRQMSYFIVRANKGLGGRRRSRTEVVGFPDPDPAGPPPTPPPAHLRRAKRPFFW